jgi:uncharacterized protein YrrD
MQFKRGAKVYTDSEQFVGDIDRVVVDPRTKEVTHLVVRKGVLFVEDKVVPIDLVGSTDEDRVVLTKQAGDLEDMPPFEIQHYLSASDEYLEDETSPAFYAPPVFWYPAVGAASIGYRGYPRRPVLTETEQQIPEGTVALKEGAKVLSAEGEHVGDIERVIIEDGQATHIVIAKGVLFKAKRLVPAEWVEVIDADKVKLVIDSVFLQKLPAYRD